MTPKNIIPAAILAVVMIATPVMATSQPLEHCDTLPTSASIETLDAKQTKAFCSEMVRILDGTTVDDLQFFAKAATLLSAVISRRAANCDAGFAAVPDKPSAPVLV